METNIAQNDLAVKILTWGRTQPTGHAVASASDFTAAETDALRRMLRSEYKDRNPAVSGCWRQGYELAIDAERIGVTNGHGPSFLIYYSRRELTGYGRATASAADLLAEIQAEVNEKYEARNRAYDLALGADPLNLVARRGAWVTE